MISVGLDIGRLGLMLRPLQMRVRRLLLSILVSRAAASLASNRWTSWTRAASEWLYSPAARATVLPIAAGRAIRARSKHLTRPQQQLGRFDDFIREFNTSAERPHEALAIRCPAELYIASPRRSDGLPELT